MEEVRSGVDPDTARYKLANYSYAFFAKEYLPHYVPISFHPRYHTPFFRMLRHVEHHITARPTVISGPRDSGKSTYGSLVLPLHAIHFPVLHLLPSGQTVDWSKRYICFLSATQPLAAKPLGDITAELEENERLHADFGDLYREASGRAPATRPWGATRARTLNGILLEAYGRWGKFRGMRYRQYRPDLLLPDDTEDDKSVQSARRRTEDMEWFTKALVNVLSANNGNTLVTGSLLHSHSFLAQLIEYGKQHGWNVRVFPIYTTDAQGKRTYLWPEKWDDAWVQEKLQEIPLSALEQEFLQNPSAGQQEIGEEEFTFYKLEDIMPLLEKGQMVVCTGVDPAAKAKEHSDYTAIVSVALDRTTGVRYVLPANISRLQNLNAKVTAIIVQALRWDAHTVGIEDVQFQYALKEAVDGQARRDGVTINTIGVPQSGDKLLRISRLYGPIGAGTIRFLREKSHSVIIDQLIHLYTTDYDDGADALEIANWVHDKRIAALKRHSGVRASIK